MTRRERRCWYPSLKGAVKKQWLLRNKKIFTVHDRPRRLFHVSLAILP